MVSYNTFFLILITNINNLETIFFEYINFPDADILLYDKSYIIKCKTKKTQIFVRERGRIWLKKKKSSKKRVYTKKNLKMG